MSEENVEVVRRTNEAYIARRLLRDRSLVDRSPSEVDISLRPDADVLTGHEGVIEALRTWTELSFPEQFVELGEVSIDEGAHRIELSYDRDGLRPGVGGRQFAFGPLVLSPVGPEPRVTTLPAERAHELCGARLDWVEAVAGG